MGNVCGWAMCVSTGVNAFSSLFTCIHLLPLPLPLKHTHICTLQRQAALCMCVLISPRAFTLVCPRVPVCPVQSFVRERRAALERYLNALAAHPAVAACQVGVNFVLARDICEGSKLRLWCSCLVVAACQAGGGCSFSHAVPWAVMGGLNRKDRHGQRLLP